MTKVDICNAIATFFYRLKNNCKQNHITPEVHVHVAPLGTTIEDAVQFQRRVLEHVDAGVCPTLGSGEVAVPGVSLRHCWHASSPICARITMHNGAARFRGQRPNRGAIFQSLYKYWLVLRATLKKIMPRRCAVLPSVNFRTLYCYECWLTSLSVTAHCFIWYMLHCTCILMSEINKQTN